MTLSPIHSDGLLNLLVTLKRKSFTGRVELINPPKNLNWNLHFCMGRLFFASGGKHPKRRWHRLISSIQSHPQPDLLLELIKTSCHEQHWDYLWLCQWIDRDQITRDQINQVIKSVLMEALFDTLQAQSCHYHIHETSTLTRHLIVLDPLELIVEIQRHWQEWQRAQITEYLPDQAPVIRRPDRLQQQASSALYQTLSRLLNGQRTLRDIALVMKRSSLEITASIVGYLKSGIIELVSVDDLMESRPPLTKPVVVPDRPLIACVDDSAWVCQSLQQLVTGAGYRFLAISEPTRAIPQLLMAKPDLIFLDLRMPNTNGYEICAQLRKLSLFQNTPIIILTGNDGIVDRVRAKMVGATDFLSKSANDQTLLAWIERYLNPTESFQPFLNRMALATA